MKPYLNDEDYKFYEDTLRTNRNGLETLDGLVIPKMFGFKDRWEYYTAGNVRSKMDGIKVPMFALQARDDWVCHEQFIPFD
jgi:predicted alpha/beta-fold hydrolase